MGENNDQENRDLNQNQEVQAENKIDGSQYNAQPNVEQSQNQQQQNPYAGQQYTSQPQNPYQEQQVYQPQGQQPMYQQPQNQQTYQQPGPQPYNYNQYQQPYQQPGQKPEGSNGMAVASMVLGIISLVLFCIPYVSVPASIVGLILGIMNVRNKKPGKGMAVTGIVLSCISLFFWLLILIAGVSLFNNREFMDGFWKEFQSETKSYY